MQPFFRKLPIACNCSLFVLYRGFDGRLPGIQFVSDPDIILDLFYGKNFAEGF